MYFSSSRGGIDWFFSRGTWTFFGVCVILAVWKVIDIVLWVASHINISWN